MMKWYETTASNCRYGDVAECVFGDAEIIWEHSEDSFQGSANILAYFPDTGKFAHYEWTYGSCCVCDEWEARRLSDDEIEQEMRDSAVWFDDVETLKRYLRLEGEFVDAKVPTAQSPTAGSIPGMMRYLFGGVQSEFEEMGAAFNEWLKERE
jgi:hypothetical protein